MKRFLKRFFKIAFSQVRDLLGCRLYTIHITLNRARCGQSIRTVTQFTSMYLYRHSIAPSKLICSQRPQNVIPTWLKEIAMAQIVRSGIIVCMGLTVTAAGVVVMIYG